MELAHRAGKPVTILEGALSGYTNRIKGSAWSPSGRMFAMFSGDSIRVLELA